MSRDEGDGSANRIKLLRRPKGTTYDLQASAQTTFPTTTLFLTPRQPAKRLTHPTDEQLFSLLSCPEAITFRTHHETEQVPPGTFVFTILQLPLSHHPLSRITVL
ncbi:hypothetical protein CF326_g4507 [Tilletia indica]|nr:hypothetical protein CF326_g4507 [Tilletia indica]